MNNLASGISRDEVRRALKKRKKWKGLDDIAVAAWKGLRDEPVRFLTRLLYQSLGRDKFLTSGEGVLLWPSTRTREDGRVAQL